MKEYEYLDELISRYPVLAPVKADIRTAYETLKECYERGGKLLIAGNGGSCADSEHIVGELMKGFKKTRRLDETLAERLLRESPELGENGGSADGSGTFRKAAAGTSGDRADWSCRTDHRIYE